MNCPHCQATIPAKLAKSARFCLMCGASLTVTSETLAIAADSARRQLAKPASPADSPKKDDGALRGVENTSVIACEMSGDLSRAHAHTRAHEGEGEPQPLDDTRLQSLPHWQRTIIEELRKIPNVTRACLMANRTSTQSAYRHREVNEVFRALWDEALEGHTDQVEQSLYEVATVGHEKTHVNKHGEAITERVRDVNAMKFWLAGNRPRTYRETHQVDVDVTHGLSQELGDVLRRLRMRRQPGENGRELAAVEVKPLGLSGEAKDC